MEKNFLIKRADDVYFDIKEDQLPDIFTSKVINCKPIKGDGYSVETSNGEIAFIYEDEGVLIIFKRYKDNTPEMHKILNEVQQNLENVAGAKCVLISI